MAIRKSRNLGEQLLLEASRSEVRSAGGSRAVERSYGPSVVAEEPSVLLAPPAESPSAERTLEAGGVPYASDDKRGHCHGAQGLRGSRWRGSPRG